MNAALINQTTDLTTLVDAKLWKEGRYHVGPCPFCGGHDRFVIKHTPQGDRWLCRKCGDGKYHTTIDFLMQRDQLDFKTALQSMGAGTLRLRDQPNLESPRRRLSLPDDTWQQAAWCSMTK